MDALSRKVGELLKKRGEQVATAESCTGGMISAALTDIAGSSDWFGYGFVTYSNQAKQDLLGVRVETLNEVGAVSEHTVREMADGALRRSGAHWALAVSGIAGPGGGSPDKPVGTVWFALAGTSGVSEVFVRRFDGDRAAVRRQTVEVALARLIDLLAAPLLV
ncbi:CinA family protein [Paludibacterium purpuratum]|uniref:CinA family protein n=1 Tax=Paludibacterium purpuratum TaxID=1144873 RepID=UPI003C7A8A44